MSKISRSILCTASAFLFICAASLSNAAPHQVHYQGTVAVDGEPYDGTGYFKFAIITGGTENVATATATAVITSGFVTSIAIDDPGNGYFNAPTVSISGGGGSGATAEAVIQNGIVTEINVTNAGSGYTEAPDVTIDAPPPATVRTQWDNERGSGSSSGVDEPAESVALPVSRGVFSVALGNDDLPGMAALSPSTFTIHAVFLRTWFSSDGNNFEQLIPDQPVLSVPYALQVADGAVTERSLNFNRSEVGSSVTASGYLSIVAGGEYNTAEGDNSIVAGGYRNTASGVYSIVAGGRDNTAHRYSIVAGGYENTAGGEYSIVAGGRDNAAGGSHSIVAGGYYNRAGGDYSFAAGRRANAQHNGTFVWADRSSLVQFASTDTNQFLIRAANGVGINTNSPSGALHVAGNTIIGGLGDDHRLGVGTDDPWTTLHVIASEGKDPFRVMAENNNRSNTVIRGYQHGGVAIGYSYDDASVPQRGLRVYGDAIKTGGGSWSAPSDRRLKTNIAPLGAGTLDQLLQLRGHTFEFTKEAVEKGLAHPGQQTGFIAQEVAEVFPDWVGRDEEGFLFITERGTTALFVEALREMRSESENAIIALKKENHDLHSKIAALQTQLADLTERAHEADKLKERLARIESLLDGEKIAAR